MYLSSNTHVRTCIKVQLCTNMYMCSSCFFKSYFGSEWFLFAFLALECATEYGHVRTTWLSLPLCRVLCTYIILCIYVGV